MQAEVSHAAAEVWIGSGSFTGEFLFGEMGELIREGVAVRHWGPAFILHNGHRGGWLGCLWSLSSSVHIDVPSIRWMVGGM